MRISTGNPALSSALRIFFALVAIVVLFGSALLWLPELVRPVWPWSIAPFNSAFLGAIYLAEFSAAIIAAAVNRW